MPEREHFLVMLPCAADQRADPYDAVCSQLRDGRLRDLSLQRPFPNHQSGAGGARGPYRFPKFKVGTLDSLMEASDDLAKVDANVEAMLSKIMQVGDQLRAEQEAEDKAFDAHAAGWHWMVETSVRDQRYDVEKYLKEWQWNQVKYTGFEKEPMKSLVTKIVKVVGQQEEGVRRAATDYAETKARLTAAEKKVHGSLLHRDLTKYIDDWKASLARRVGSADLQRVFEQVVHNRVDADGRWDGSHAVPGVGALFVCVPKMAEQDFVNGYQNWGVFADREGKDQRMYQDWLSGGGYREGKTNHMSAGFSISQIELYNGDRPVSMHSAEASTMGHGHINGFVPFVDGDTGRPENALRDNDCVYFDANVKDDKGGLVICFPAEVSVDSYRFRSNAGDPSCDPCDFELQGWVSKGTAQPATVVITPKNPSLGKPVTLVIERSHSEKECMDMLAAQVRVPADHHIQVLEGGADGGISLALRYEDVKDSEVMYDIVPGKPPPYSTNKKDSEIGTWVTLHQTTDFSVSGRRSWTPQLRCSKAGSYKRLRFKTSRTRGKADFGPLAYVPFAAVPGTADKVCDHEDMGLWAVLCFKQKQADFIAACRERKLTVRTYDAGSAAFDQSGAERKKDPAEEHRDAKDKRKRKQADLKQKILVGFSETFSAWIHIKAIRVYVEGILRYGLPPDYVCTLWTVSAKEEKDMRHALEEVARNPDYAQRIISHRGYDEPEDQGALQEGYPYVSLRIANLLEK